CPRMVSRSRSENARGMAARFYAMTTLDVESQKPLSAQRGRRFEIERVVPRQADQLICALRAVDDHAVVARRGLDAHVAVDHVVEHGMWIAQHRIAVATAARERRFDTRRRWVKQQLLGIASAAVAQRERAWQAGLTAQQTLGWELESVVHARHRPGL